MSANKDKSTSNPSSRRKKDANQTTETAPATPTPATKKRKTRSADQENVPSPNPTPQNNQANGPGKHPTLAQINADLKRQLDEAQALKTRAEEAKAQAERRLRKFRKASKKQTVEKAKVPRPKGSAGRKAKGFSLKVAMGLEKDGVTYSSILRSVRDLVTAAGLDCMEDFRNQPPAKLGEIYRVARERQKHLKNFTNNWPTAEIARQFLANRRKAEVNRRKALAEAGDVELGQNEEGGNPSRAAKKRKVTYEDDDEDEDEDDEQGDGNGEDDDDDEGDERDEGDEENCGASSVPMNV
ncbi:hypothetical protein JAAARDRAFT_40311 [Jaapia argillacea MUCL 33604]|uniref:Uncharacterized protein n=1 Tax=Jaapia argillacea MUCL 33604 TaxID=933084 RepID=A0A067PC49_9AGAM|nr:hypothetical protein JAAARDRAFT_40311 [Jaapia argillacea MUCL 33604]